MKSLTLSTIALVCFCLLPLQVWGTKPKPSPVKDSELIVAIKEFHNAEAEAKKDRSARDDVRRSAIKRNIELSSRMNINALLKQGADFNTEKDQMGKTALMWLVKDNARIFSLPLCPVSTLLDRITKDKNLQLETTDNQGNTALIWAAKETTPITFGHSDNVEIIKALITRGAKVDAQNQQGETALMWAVSKGSELVCTTLIEQGKANVNLKDTQGDTAPMRLIISAIEKQSKALPSKKTDKKAPKTYKEGLDAELAPLKNAWSAWHKEVSHYSEIAEILVKAGANINLENNKQQTALTLIADYENAALNVPKSFWLNLLPSQKLLEAVLEGVRTAEDLQALKAINFPAGKPQELVQERIAQLEKQLGTKQQDATAAAKQQNTNDETALLKYAKDGNLDAIIAILQKNPNVNLETKDNDGNTPLTLAAKYWHGTSMQFLHLIGATTESAQSEHEEWAEAGGIYGLRFIYNEKTDNVIGAYLEQAKQGERITDRQKIQQIGNSCKLIEAVLKSDITKVTQLLQGQPKPDLNIVSWVSDNTPLMLAIKQAKPALGGLTGKDTEIALALIEAGADVNAQDLDGSTILDKAIQWNNTKIITALKAKGAKNATEAQKAQQEVGKTAYNPEVEGQEEEEEDEGEEETGTGGSGPGASAEKVVPPAAVAAV